MCDICQYIAFTLDTQRFALPVDIVDRVLPSLDITRLPNAPASILGIINVQGCIIPVCNLRVLLGLPEREPALEDHILLIGYESRLVALIVDRTLGLVDIASYDLISSHALVSGLPYLRGVVKEGNGMMLLLKPEALCSCFDHRTVAKMIGEA